jgi:hypothetical protein
MCSVRWLGVLAVTAILLVGCNNTATQGRTASTTRTGTPTTCREPQPASNFAPSQASDRNLEIVWFKGSQKFVVRDITDILHPTNIRTYDGVFGLKFVSAREVSFADTSGLIRSALEGTGRRTSVACGALPFDWSPDGTSVAYVSRDQIGRGAEVHLLRDGRTTVAYSFPLVDRAIGCETRACGETYDLKLLYSPSGAFFSLVENLFSQRTVRIWTSDGKLVKSLDGDATSNSDFPTMSVWSGDALYWRDKRGVVRWRDGSESVVLSGVVWINPHGSPAGGQIVYETRDSGGGTAHILIYDTVSGKAREVATSRSEPFFLNSHLIWYKQERPCAAGDGWPCGQSAATTIETGKTLIYDLDDKTETESIIAAVFDVWPHAA